MKILMMTLFLFSTALFAGDRNSAYQAICKKLAFESERKQCAYDISQFNYFDDQALNICTSFTFHSTRMECLGYIGDKFYYQYETTNCRESVFDSEKLSCLRNSGTPYNQTCLPRQETLSQLQMAQQELRSGNTGTVDKRLTYLIGKFSQACQ